MPRKKKELHDNTSMTIATDGSGPEETVRQRTIRDLKKLGWTDSTLRWKPEWPIPDTPHDLTKRERGQKYSVCGSADLVAFANGSGEWHALQVIFELKSPSIDKGKSQLLRYLSNEPMAKMGYWTNGKESLAVYKRHQSEWLFVQGAALPHPTDNLAAPPDIPPSWNTLRIPTEVELSGALRRLVAVIVTGDQHVTRRDEQLRELIHLLLVKLDSDAFANRSSNRKEPVKFRIYGDEMSKVHMTASMIRELFSEYFQAQQTRIFTQQDTGNLKFSDETIFAVVAELSPFRILGDDIDLLSKAFQIVRTDALKSGEGQYLTPSRIVKPAVMALDIKSSDKVIDPACGTGTFLVEALRYVARNEFPDESESWNLIKWANDSLYGVDKDSIGVKLTRVAMRDGSTHVLLGDSIRINQWNQNFPRLGQELGSPRLPYVCEQFTVVLTNPPFGQDLKIKAADCRASGYSIANAAAMGGPNDFADLEIGLLYLDLSHKLLRIGGRVGIVLPETYFFSHSYRWLPDWLHGRFKLRGMLNIPMEAFEEFCRAKTNFYIFEKIGNQQEV